MCDADSISAAYADRFGRRPGVTARAPGRVNIIGEHTDYNQGLVLPFAIGQSLFVAAGPAGSGQITVHSLAKDQTVTFPSTVDGPSQQASWQNYIRGVCCGLSKRGVVITGADLLIGGDLPLGGGLSSSAALCVATALALLKLADTVLPSFEIAALTQQAEQEFAGTPCGIMDPYVCLFGKAKHALLLDCRSKTHEYLDLELGNAGFALIDSGLAHELSSGLYEQRVQECKSAAAAIAQHETSVCSLREVTIEMLERQVGRLDPVLARRTRHVISENARVLQARQALANKRCDELGCLLSASHQSLRDDYEVSCPQVDELVSALQEIDGVWGARMVGGGSGGMVLALIESAAVAGLQATLRRRFTSGAGAAGSNPPRGHAKRVCPVQPSAGANCA